MFVAMQILDNFSAIKNWINDNSELFGYLIICALVVLLLPIIAFILACICKYKSRAMEKSIRQSQAAIRRIEHKVESFELN